MIARDQARRRRCRRSPCATDMVLAVRARPPWRPSARNTWCRSRRCGRPRCRAPTRRSAPASRPRPPRRASRRSRHRASSSRRRCRPSSRRRKVGVLAGHRQVEEVAVAEDLALAGLGQDDEFVAEVAADRAGVGAHRDRLQAHAREGAQIGDEHAVVGGLAPPRSRGRRNRRPSSGTRAPRITPKRGRTSSRNFHWMW